MNLVVQNTTLIQEPLQQDEQLSTKIRKQNLITIGILCTILLLWVISAIFGAGSYKDDLANKCMIKDIIYDTINKKVHILFIITLIIWLTFPIVIIICNYILYKKEIKENHLYIKQTSFIYNIILFIILLCVIFITFCDLFCEFNLNNDNINKSEELFNIYSIIFIFISGLILLIINILMLIYFIYLIMIRSL